MSIIPQELTRAMVETQLQNNLEKKTRNVINYELMNYLLGKLPATVRLATNQNTDIADIYGPGMDEFGSRVPGAIFDGVELQTDNLVFLF